MFHVNCIAQFLVKQTNTTNIFTTKTTEGWCANNSAKDSGRLKTDKALIPTLADIFTGKTECHENKVSLNFRGQLFKTSLA